MIVTDTRRETGSGQNPGSPCYLLTGVVEGTYLTDLVVVLRRIGHQGFFNPVLCAARPSYHRYVLLPQRKPLVKT